MPVKGCIVFLLVLSVLDTACYGTLYGSHDQMATAEGIGTRPHRAKADWAHGLVARSASAHYNQLNGQPPGGHAEI